jgi:probable rRNA maturation factor
VPRITILTHDTRWARLRPSLREAITIGLSFLRKQEFTVFNKGDSRLRGNDKHEGFALTLVLTNDAEVQSLNHQYRKKNKPTNVLSFPDGTVLEGVTQLGDVVMSYDTLKREAAEQRKSLKNHAIHLAVHGTLHLLGYDHETSEKDAKRMESLEIKILAGIGIANPYECT